MLLMSTYSWQDSCVVKSFSYHFIGVYFQENKKYSDHLSSIVDQLESFIDPFDLDVFTPCLNTNLSRQTQRSLVILKWFSIFWDDETEIHIFWCGLSSMKECKQEFDKTNTKTLKKTTVFLFNSGIHKYVFLLWIALSILEFSWD